MGEIWFWTATGILHIAHIFGGPSCPIWSLSGDTGALPMGRNAANLLPPSNAKEAKSPFNIISTHSAFPSMAFIHKVFLILRFKSFLVSFMFRWPSISIQLCNKNQLDALFILWLFRQSTSVWLLTVCWPTPANRQSSEKHNTYQLYIYSIPLDDGL